jgi:hypothetical protein
VHAAHARVHARLRAPASEHDRRLAELRDAVRDLSGVARSRLFEAHLHAVKGWYAWFARDARRADRHLVRAEALAREEGAPWVLYSVFRARAFMLREAGKHDSALDHAKLAETLARDNASHYRLKWIQEEFGLNGGATGKERVAESTPRLRLSGADDARAIESKRALASTPPRARGVWHQERNGSERKTVVP